MMKLSCQECFCSKYFDLQHHMSLLCSGEFRNGAVLGILTETVGVQCNHMLLIPQKKVDVSYGYFLIHFQYYLAFC